jgi:hypothetical protein
VSGKRGPARRSWVFFGERGEATAPFLRLGIATCEATRDVVDLRHSQPSARSLHCGRYRALGWFLQYSTEHAGGGAPTTSRRGCSAVLWRDTWRIPDQAYGLPQQPGPPVRARNSTANRKPPGSGEWGPRERAPRCVLVALARGASTPRRGRPAQSTETRTLGCRISSSVVGDLGAAHRPTTAAPRT